MTRILGLTGLLLTLTACKGGSLDDTGTPSTDDSEATTDDTDGTDDTEDTGEAPEIWEPVAIGFEYIGGYDAGGRLLTGWTSSTDGSYIDPYVIVTLADSDYFGLTGDEKDGHYCELYYYFDWTDGEFSSYGPSDPDAGNPWDPPGSGVTTWASFEGQLTLDSVSTDTQALCESLDPEEWAGIEGVYADGTPYARLEYIHFGLAFGALSDYVAEGWTEETIKEYGDFMFTSYIAINHFYDGDLEFNGFDWSSSFLWQWDEVEGEILLEDKKYYIGQSVESGNASGFMTSSARWYEDFPNLDLDRMAEE